MHEATNINLAAGARAARDLLLAVQVVSNETCGASDVDERDYVAIAALISRSLEANFVHADGARREGFLRAFADLLALEADGCGLPQEWTPLTTTARSFEATRGASHG